ncbi:MAG: phosphate/phosphite/phosphonate ABC transporter substrate-binding protein [Candidatus Thiodiazotropha sp.]
MERPHPATLLLFLALACQSVNAGETCVGDTLTGHRYSVNLVPRQPATELYRTWAPLLERIGKQAGLCFDITIPDGFPAFEHAMQAGKSDFIFLNPYHQLMAHDTPGYLPLIRDGHSRLAGILVVHNDSPIHSIRQLEGKTVAFPAPNAYVASLLLRAQLAKEGIDIRPEYVASHSNVMRAVALGAVEAGGVANTTLEHQPASLKSHLRILYQSPFYMPHPFSVHPRVVETDRKKVIEGFISLTSDPVGRKMLADVQMTDPIKADYEDDYKILESLGLERFIERPNLAETP